MLAIIFYVGGYLNSLITTFFEGIVFPPLYAVVDAQVANPFITSAVHSTLLALAAVLAIAIPYILIFFIFLAILEDVGYLPRVALLLDRQAHVIGLHGRSIIPHAVWLRLQRARDYGDAGPSHEKGADHHHRRSSRSFRARRARRSSSAWRRPTREVQYALAIYLISFVLIIASGRLLRATVPGRTAGLVLEIPLIRRPALVPDPEEDVAADEGVSLHRRAPAHRREYRVRMARSDRPQSIHRGADGADHCRYSGTSLLHGNLPHLRRV